MLRAGDNHEICGKEHNPQPQAFGCLGYIFVLLGSSRVVSPKPAQKELVQLAERLSADIIGSHRDRFVDGCHGTGDERASIEFSPSPLLTYFDLCHESYVRCVCFPQSVEELLHRNVQVFNMYRCSWIALSLSLQSAHN
jgi:hypothetical protein